MWLIPKSEYGLSLFSGNESVVALLFTAVQKSELQMFPFEISFHLGVEPWAPRFILYFTILFQFFLSCLQKVLLTMQREDLFLSLRGKKVNVEQYLTK